MRKVWPLLSALLISSSLFAETDDKTPFVTTTIKNESVHINYASAVHSSICPLMVTSFKISDEGLMPKLRDPITGTIEISLSTPRDARCMMAFGRSHKTVKLEKGDSFPKIRPGSYKVIVNGVVATEDLIISE